MSALIGNRSGNRGSCAGSCRQKYNLISNGKKVNSDEYILSTMKEVSPEVYSKYIVCKYQYDQEIEDNFLKSMAPSLIGFLSAVTLGIPCILYMAAQKDKLEILDEEYENGIEIEM